MLNRSSKRGQGPKDFNQIAWEVGTTWILAISTQRGAKPNRTSNARTRSRL